MRLASRRASCSGGATGGLPRELEPPLIGKALSDRGCTAIGLDSSHNIATDELSAQDDQTTASSWALQSELSEVVIRYFCACLTCGHAHTLRVAMGHNPNCDHTFRCFGCAQEMTIHVTQRPEIATAEIDCRENCREGTVEGTIINLHPDFPIPEEDLHRDQAFPWLKNVEQVAKAQIAAGFDGETEALVLAKLMSGQTLEGLPDLWTTVDRAWSLARSGREALSRDVLKGYGRTGYSGPTELTAVIFDFCAFLIVPAYGTLYQAAAKEVKAISSRAPLEFERFRQHYHDELREPALDRYHEVLREYFRELSEFHQVLLLQKYGLPLAPGAVASSRAFRRTKMFYGNAYEALTANFAVLACLNNVGSERRFDQFKHMTLAQYVSLHKASRARAFSDVEPFAAFALNLNSGLRNASHHAAMRLVEPQQTIEYRSGGSSPVQRIGYAEYLSACTELFLRSCALLMVELLL